MATTAVTPAVHLSFWERLKAEALRLFHALPKWEVVAADAINVAAPITESILAFDDPALGAVVAPIITTIQTKLATASTLINGLEKSTSLTSALADIQTNLASILSLAEVKNSTSAAKITAQVNLLASVVASIQAAVGTPTAPGVTSTVSTSPANSAT